MKVGYKNWEDDELEETDCDSVTYAAEQFADEHHEIDEASDMDFELVVIDDEGVVHNIEMTTEYDPRYIVSKSTKEK